MGGDGRFPQPQNHKTQVVFNIDEDGGEVGASSTTQNHYKLMDFHSFYGSGRRRRHPLPHGVNKPLECGEAVVPTAPRTISDFRNLLWERAGCAPPTP